MPGIFGDEGYKNESNAEDVLRAADSAALHDAVLAGVRRGWLVGFGRSRDGFSVSVSVLDSGDRSNAWCTTVEELENALRRVVTAATDLDRAPEQALPSKPKGGRVDKPRRAH